MPSSTRRSATSTDFKVRRRVIIDPWATSPAREPEASEMRRHRGQSVGIKRSMSENIVPSSCPGTHARQGRKCGIMRRQALFGVMVSISSAQSKLQTKIRTDEGDCRPRPHIGNGKGPQAKSWFPFCVNQTLKITKHQSQAMGNNRCNNLPDRNFAIPMKNSALIKKCQLRMPRCTKKRRNHKCGAHAHIRGSSAWTGELAWYYWPTGF